MSDRRIATLSIVLAALSGSVAADDIVPADWSIPQTVDHYINAGFERHPTTVAARADDSAILRRTTLDIAGRIPSRTECDWYLGLPEETRREELVDRLLTLPDYEFHLCNELDSMLLPNQPYNDEFRRYLLWAVQEQHSWDQMFREMLLPSATEPPQKGASQFLRSRINEVDDLANDTAVLFFGVNISCAKCHDHPLVEDWKQDHFYGMKAFFSRTYKTKKDMLAERFFDELKYQTTSGDEKTASYLFLTGRIVENGTPEYDEARRKELDALIKQQQSDDNAGEIPIPDFSPRSQLVEIGLSDDGAVLLARNIVNRVWARLMGTGLVNPLDQMHTGNPSSHPELLDWLAQDFIAHGYDLKYLTRGLVLSEAYARSSEWTTAEEQPAPWTFAVAQVRPLTPRQLAASLVMASTPPESWPLPEASDEYAARRKSLADRGNSWVREFEQPSPQFQVAVDEALFFSNNERVYNDIVREGGDRIVGHVKTIEDDQQAIRELWINVLSREPREEEKEAAIEWLHSGDNRIVQLQHLTWALIAGPEMRFNH